MHFKTWLFEEEESSTEGGDSTVPTNVDEEIKKTEQLCRWIKKNNREPLSDFQLLSSKKEKIIEEFYLAKHLFEKIWNMKSIIPYERFLLTRNNLNLLFSQYKNGMKNNELQPIYNYFFIKNEIETLIQDLNTTEELSKFYKEKNIYPDINPSNIKENKLAEMLFYLKKRYKNHQKSIINAIIRINGIALGLPRNWLELETKISSGETKIINILKKLFGNHQTQKKFPLCRNKQCLRFDAAFLHNEKLYLVEYHGKQHFSSIPFFHRTETAFHNQMERDKIKFEFCRQNNIPLLVIPFWKHQEIEKLIIDFSKTNGFEEFFANPEKQKE